LVFKLYEASSNSKDPGILIGTAIALLDSLKEGLGAARESLIRNYTIPVLEKHSLEFMGTVTFDFLVVTPFRHPAVMSVTPHEIWKSNGLSQVVGHRGMFSRQLPIALTLTNDKVLGRTTQLSSACRLVRIQYR
jgi:glycerophosphodiester phosphodiesterase